VKVVVVSLNPVPIDIVLTDDTSPLTISISTIGAVKKLLPVAYTNCTFVYSPSTYPAPDVKENIFKICAYLLLVKATQCPPKPSHPCQQLRPSSSSACSL
jgi:hypothetical protein